MRILTEQELRRAVDSTVKRTLTENSQNEGLGGWLLAGAAGLLGLHLWPKIKSVFSGQDNGNTGSQTPSQDPNIPSSGNGSGSTDSVQPPLSGSPSDGQLEDWQKEWRRNKGQGWEQGMQDKPSFDKASQQPRTDSQEQGRTRPSRDYREYSELDKVDAILSNPMALRQLSRDEIRLLFVYRMMLSNSSSGGNRSNYAPNGYARGHGARNSRTSIGRSRRTTTSGNGRYAPGHKVR